MCDKVYVLGGIYFLLDGSVGRVVGLVVLMDGWIYIYKYLKYVGGE